MAEGTVRNSKRPSQNYEEETRNPSETRDQEEEPSQNSDKAHSAAIKILAECKAGELLKKVERAVGGRGKTLATMAGVYKDSQIAPRTGSRWQTIAPAAPT